MPASYTCQNESSIFSFFRENNIYGRTCVCAICIYCFQLLPDLVQAANGVIQKVAGCNALWNHLHTACSRSHEHVFRGKKILEERRPNEAAGPGNRTRGLRTCGTTYILWSGSTLLSVIELEYSGWELHSVSRKRFDQSSLSLVKRKRKQRIGWSHQPVSLQQGTVNT